MISHQKNRTYANIQTSHHRDTETQRKGRSKRFHEISITWFLENFQNNAASAVRLLARNVFESRIQPADSLSMVVGQWSFFVNPEKIKAVNAFCINGFF
ncbi:hypothetical protein ACO0K3_18190 [Undibacterium sp. Rencai35W]|uniref:hypothetical protein n=1 Tax=Undibacterium sp. Rencai35W TaxID=3413046 RepID=UPI003BF0ADCB